MRQRKESKKNGGGEREENQKKLNKIAGTREQSLKSERKNEISEPGEEKTEN